MTWEDRGPYFEAKAGEFWLRYGYYGSSRTSGYPAWWKVFDADMQLLAKGEAMGGKSAIKKASDEARNRGAKFSAGAQYASASWSMSGGALVANAGAVTLRVKRGNEGHEWTVSEGGSVSKSGRQDSESAAKLAAESAARSLGAKFSDRSTMKYGVNWASVDPKWGGGETAHVNSDKGRWRLQAKQGKGGAWTWLADATHNLQKSRSGNATSVADAKAKAESAMMGSGEKFSDRSTTMTTTTKATPVLAFTAYAQAGEGEKYGAGWIVPSSTDPDVVSVRFFENNGKLTVWKPNKKRGETEFEWQSETTSNSKRGVASDLASAKSAAESAARAMGAKFSADRAAKYGAAWKQEANGESATSNGVLLQTTPNPRGNGVSWSVRTWNKSKKTWDGSVSGSAPDKDSARAKAEAEAQRLGAKFAAVGAQYAADWKETIEGVAWFINVGDVSMSIHWNHATNSYQWVVASGNGNMKKGFTSKVDQAKSAAEQAARAMGAKFSDARQYADTTFTVYVKNLVLGSANFVGTFATQQEAEDYANTEASRSRKFVGFEVWTGTPQKYGKLVKVVREGVPQKQFTAKYSVTDQEFKILVPFLTGGGRARPLPAGQPIYESLERRGLVKKLPSGQYDITDAGKKVVHAQWEKDDPGMSTVTMRRASAARSTDTGFLQYSATPTVVKPLPPRAVYTDGLMSGYAVCESACSVEPTREVKASEAGAKYAADDGKKYGTREYAEVQYAVSWVTSDDEAAASGPRWSIRVSKSGNRFAWTAETQAGNKAGNEPTMSAAKSAAESAARGMGAKFAGKYKKDELGHGSDKEGGGGGGTDDKSKEEGDRKSEGADDKRSADDLHKEIGQQSSLISKISKSANESGRPDDHAKAADELYKNISDREQLAAKYRKEGDEASALEQEDLMLVLDTKRKQHLSKSGKEGEPVSIDSAKSGKGKSNPLDRAAGERSVLAMNASKKANASGKAEDHRAAIAAHEESLDANQKVADAYRKAGDKATALESEDFIKHIRKEIAKHEKSLGVKSGDK